MQSDSKSQCKAESDVEIIKETKDQTSPPPTTLTEEQQSDRNFALHALKDFLDNFSANNVPKALHEVQVLDTELANEVKTILKGLFILQLLILV